LKVLDLHLSRDPLSCLSEVGKRLYSLEHDLHIEVVTTAGTLVYDLEEGWLTDLRSGGFIADLIVPYKGSPANVAGWLVHDANFGYVITQAQIDMAPQFDHPLSFGMSNELLDAMQDYAKMMAWKRSLMVNAVSSPIGRSAYDRMNAMDRLNAKRVKFRWCA
jgi:hypothetical protein